MTATEEYNGSESQLVSGLAMYNHLAEEHSQLHAAYQLVLDHRRRLQLPCVYTEEWESLFPRYIEDCRAYSRLLLRCLRPAQGRLSALLGHNCSNGLAYSLFYDFCQHLLYYINVIEVTMDPTGRDEIFVLKTKELLEDYMEQCENFKTNEPENELSQTETEMFTPDIFKNYHEIVKEDMELDQENFQKMKKAKVNVALNRNPGSWSDEMYWPKVGVYAKWSGSLTQKTEHEGGFEAAVSMMGDLLDISALTRQEEKRGLEIPYFLEDYLSQQGADLLVVIDKLDPTAAVSDLVLKIFLEIFAFHAKCLDSAEASPLPPRMENCHSPQFSLSLEQVLCPLEENLGKGDLRNFATSKPLRYYRNVNAETCYSDPAADPSWLKITDDEKFKHVETEYRRHIIHYMDSIIIKLIIQSTELAFQTEDPIEKDSVSRNKAITTCVDFLNETTARLCGENCKSEEGVSPGHKMIYINLVKYLFTSLCPHLVNQPLCTLHISFFKFIYNQIEPLCTLKRASEYSLEKVPSYISLLENLCWSLLVVIIHGTSSNNIEIFKLYMEQFHANGMRTILESAMYHVTEKQAPKFASALKQIILNIKTSLSSGLQKGYSLVKSDCVHHCGNSISPMFVSLDDKEVCSVASVVSILLVLFKRCDGAPAEACLERLREGGLCCCLDSKLLLSNLLSDLKEKTSHVVNLSLDFIKNVVIEDLGGYRHQKPTDCSACLFETVSLEPKMNRTYGSEIAVQLVGHKISRIIHLLPSSEIVEQINDSQSKSISYVDLKWSGLELYKNLLDSYLFERHYAEHLFHIARFSCSSVQRSLINLVFRPLLDNVLDKSFCNHSNLNDETKIPSLALLFNSLQCILLTNDRSDLKFRVDYDVIRRMLEVSKDFTLLKACYGFVCSLLRTPIYTSKAELTSGFSKSRKMEYSNMSEVMAWCFYTVTNWWCQFLSTTTHYPADEINLQFSKLLYVWTTVAVMTKDSSFVALMEELNVWRSSLLTQLLDTLLCPQSSETRIGALWCQGQENLFQLLGALLTVLAKSSMFTSQRATLCVLVAALAEQLSLPCTGVESLVSALLGNAAASVLQSPPGGRVVVVCGGQSGGDDCMEALLETEQDHPCNLPNEWPELVMYSVEALLKHHKIYMEARPSGASTTASPAGVTTVGEASVVTPQPEQSSMSSLLSATASMTVSYLGSYVGGYVGMGTAAETVQEKGAEESGRKTPTADAALMRCESVSSHCAMMERCFSKILSICEAGVGMRQALNKMKLMDKLLEGFNDVLRHPREMEGLVVLVIKLWQCLASVSISPSQLSMYFSLFMGQRPPVSELLSALHATLKTGIDDPLHCVTYSTLIPASLAPPRHLSAYDRRNRLLAPNVCAPVGGCMVPGKLRGEQEAFNIYRGEIIENRVGCDTGVQWCRVACVLPVTTEALDWQPLTSPVTIALWCKLDVPDQTNEENVNASMNEDADPRAARVHIVTVGVESLLLSVFIDVDSGWVECTLLRCLPHTDTVLEELCVVAAAAPQLLDGRWHHLVLALPGFNPKKRGSFTVTLVLDGKALRFPVTVKPIGTLKSADSRNGDHLFLLLGHRGMEQTPSEVPSPEAADTDIAETEAGQTVKPTSVYSSVSLSMTNVFMFKTGKLTSFELLVLMALGKDAENLMATDMEVAAPVLKKLLTSEVLDSWEVDEGPLNLLADHLYAKLENVLLPLVESLVVSHNCRRPEEFLLYDKFSSSVNERCNKYGAVVRCSGLLYGGPLRVPGEQQQQQQQRAHHSLLHLGGVQHLLFLLARVVELNDVDYTKDVGRLILHTDYINFNYNSPTESNLDTSTLSLKDQNVKLKPCDKTLEDCSFLDEHNSTSNGKRKSQGLCQAQCIGLLYWCVENSPQLCRQFHAVQGNMLVMRLLYSRKMDTRLDVLKALLDQCFSEPLIKIDRNCPLSGLPSSPEDPIVGHFRTPSAEVIVTDAQLLSAVLRHWHEIELKKLEHREKAKQRRLAESKSESSKSEDKNDGNSIKSELSDFYEREEAERPVHCSVHGPCHAVDALHRCTALLLPSRLRHASFNAAQLSHVTVLHALLTAGQVLQVKDCRQLQVSPEVLSSLLSLLLPPPPATDSLRQHQHSASTTNWPVDTLQQLLRTVLLCVEPRSALLWRAEACVGNLKHLFQPYQTRRRQIAVEEKRRRQMLEAELAEEVTEELLKSYYPMDDSGKPTESKSLPTREEQNKLEAGVKVVEEEVVGDAKHEVEHDAELEGSERAESMEAAGEVESSKEEGDVKTVENISECGKIESSPKISHEIDHSVGQDNIKFQVKLEPKTEVITNGHAMNDNCLGETVAMDTENAMNKTEETKKTGKVVSNLTIQDSSNANCESTKPKIFQSIACRADSAQSSVPSSPLLSKAKKIEYYYDMRGKHVAELLVTSLDKFLARQTTQNFAKYVNTCIEPHHIAVLAYHQSEVVRCAALKIWRQILCRPAPRLTRRHQFLELSKVIHYQLYGRDSSSDLLEQAMLITSTRPGGYPANLSGTSPVAVTWAKPPSDQSISSNFRRVENIIMGFNSGVGLAKSSSLPSMKPGGSQGKSGLHESKSVEESFWPDDAAVLTETLSTQLDQAMQDHITNTSAPLFALLPKVKKNNAKTIEVLNFLDKLIECTMKSGGKLLNMKYFGESLILTFGETLNLGYFRVTPVVNTLTNLIRSMLILNDETSSKGFSLLYKLFLLCENLKLSRDKNYQRSLKSFGKILVNCLTILLDMMLEFDICAYKKGYKKQRLAKRQSTVALQAALQAQRNSRRAFIPRRADAEYASEHLEYSTGLQCFLDSTGEGASSNWGGSGDRGMTLMQRTLTLLKMTRTIIYKLDWLNVRQEEPEQVSGNLSLFLLDLHLNMLDMWNKLPSKSATSSRSGDVAGSFTDGGEDGRSGRSRGGGGNWNYGRNTFFILSHQFYPQLSTWLPELLCSLCLPPRSINVEQPQQQQSSAAAPAVAVCAPHASTSTREFLCGAAVAKVLEERRILVVLPYCINQGSKLMVIFAAFLCEWALKSASLNVKSSTFSLLTTLRRLLPWTSEESERDIEDAVENYKNYFISKQRVAKGVISVAIENCLKTILEDHEGNKVNITDLYDTFLIEHGRLKRAVLNDIEAGEEHYEELTKVWRDLSSRFSIQSSPWERPSPLWWELMDKEGEDRTRKTLTRGYITVHPRHLKNPSQHLLDDKSSYSKCDETVPLKSVLHDEGNPVPYGEERTRFPRCAHHQIHFTGKAWIIKPGVDFKGTLFVTTDGIYFRGEKDLHGYSRDKDVKFDATLQVSLKDISKIVKRRYRLEETAVELHLHSRRSWFIVCNSSEERDSVFDLTMKGAELAPNLPLKQALDEATKAWMSGELTNFDYLISLNTLAGRTYNDLSQYPIFPYVLTDYSSAILDLTNERIYRDLSKPLPVQDKEREDKFKLKYIDHQSNDRFGEGYHYTNLYSNGTIVQNYLVRLPPFTLYFLHFQGGKFDQPSRTFQSIEKSYNLVARDTYADFKEAIPEMYFLPEMFVNSEGFNFNLGHPGSSVNDVILPRWSQGDPRKFVLYHRAALESHYVTKNLPQWIDLVFGYKQTGKRSLDAVNIYHPSAYLENVSRKDDDPVWEEMMSMYGEAPLQLFPTTRHPRPNSEALTDQPTNDFLFSKDPSSTVQGMNWGSFAFFPPVGQNKGSPDLEYVLDSAALNANPPILLKLAKSEGRSGGTWGRPSATGGKRATGGRHGDSRASADEELLGKNFELAEVAGYGLREFIAVQKGAIVMTDSHGAVHIVQVCAGDGVGRAWGAGHPRPYPLFVLPSYVQVTCSGAGGTQVWLGSSCGLVIVCNLEFQPFIDQQTRQQGQMKERARQTPVEPPPLFSLHCSSQHRLHGHSEAVTALSVCAPRNVALTGDAHGTCILWDVHEPAQLRSVTCFPGCVQHITVSAGSGDWLVVAEESNYGGSAVPLTKQLGSVLRLHGHNGGVAAVAGPCRGRVLAVAATNLKEGKAVNLYATTTEDSVVLWSAWDLQQLVSVRCRVPITMLRWSPDAQYLCVVWLTGAVKVFTSPLHCDTDAVPKLRRVAWRPNLLTLKLHQNEALVDYAS